MPGPYILCQREDTCGDAAGDRELWHRLRGSGSQPPDIDRIAGVRPGDPIIAVGLMLAAYLLYSASQLLQGLVSARLSQRIVA